MKQKAKYYILAFSFLALIAVILPVSACDSGSEPKAATPGGAVLNGLTSAQLLDVATNPDMDEVIKQYEGFTVSFNPTMHLPNWVAWSLTKENLDNATLTREDNFRADNSVPGCATLADYRGSGYDRGHMAPAADMKWSAEAMDNACYLTNICPQLHELNNGTWKYLEEKCRSNAQRDKELIVICGPVLTKGFTKYIGNTPVPVPPSFFKVVLIPESQAGGPQAIGFLMPHGYVEGGMQATAVSVDEIERITGHDFFHLLDDAIENKIEAECDFNRFSTGKVSKKASFR